MAIGDFVDMTYGVSSGRIKLANSQHTQQNLNTTNSPTLDLLLTLRFCVSCESISHTAQHFNAEMLQSNKPNCISPFHA